MKFMTPEERFDRIERWLELLASHQARLSASVEALRESSSRHDAQIAHLMEVSSRHEEITSRHDGQILSLTDALTSLVRVFEDQGRRTDERIGRLTEAQQHTDERLNSLISTVERYLSNGSH